MIEFPPFEPRDVDIKWLIDMINLVQDGGTIAYPATGLIYKVRKDIRVFELTNPEILEERIDSAETHWRTGVVLEKLDWEILP